MSAASYMGCFVLKIVKKKHLSLVTKGKAFYVKNISGHCKIKLNVYFDVSDTLIIKVFQQIQEYK